MFWILGIIFLFLNLFLNVLVSRSFFWFLKCHFRKFLICFAFLIVVMIFKYFCTERFVDVIWTSGPLWKWDPPLTGPTQLERVGRPPLWQPLRHWGAWATPASGLQGHRTGALCWTGRQPLGQIRSFVTAFLYLLLIHGLNKEIRRNSIWMF